MSIELVVQNSLIGLIKKLYRLSPDLSCRRTKTQRLFWTSGIFHSNAFLLCRLRAHEKNTNSLQRIVSWFSFLLDWKIQFQRKHLLFSTTVEKNEIGWKSLVWDIFESPRRPSRNGNKITFLLASVALAITQNSSSSKCKKDIKEVLLVTDRSKE